MGRVYTRPRRGAPFFSTPVLPVSVSPPRFPAARGRRISFRKASARLRHRWEGLLGSSVVRARTQRGGFSPGVAARLQLADGRRVFLKAVSSEANPEAPELYRREARVAAVLPRGVPAPRFLWVDEEPPWVALAFEEAEGRPPRLPWRRAELRRVLSAILRMSRALTPSPLDLPTFAQVHGPAFHNWREALRGKGPVRGTDPLGHWVRDHVPELARLESRCETASAGPTLLHCDLRADNLLLSPRAVHFVDWPFACVGAGWVDLALFLPSVAMQGGPAPWELWDPHPLARSASPEGVDAVLAALGGHFLFRGAAPAPPGLPTLRPFQWAQGQQVIRWLRYRWEGVDPARGTVPPGRFRPSGPSASP